MYHGAEHKNGIAWENGQELTVEISGLFHPHPRCGTSFILVGHDVSIWYFPCWAG